MDPLDDLFDEGAAKTARAAGKFQPKVKARPLKKGPIAARPPSSSQTIQLGDADKCGRTEAPKDGKPSARDDTKCLGPTESSSKHINPGENACATLGSHMVGDIITSDNNRPIEKSVGEIANISLGLESNDFLPRGANAMESFIPSSEAPIVNASKEDAEVLADDSVPGSNIPDADDADNSEPPAAQDAFTCGEPVVATCERVSQIDSIDLGIEEIETYPCLGTSDGLEQTTLSGRHTRKFQPKPKVQVFTKNCHAGIPNSNAKDSDSTDFMDKERPPTCDTDDVIVVSSLGFDHAPPTESTPEVPASEEIPNVEADFPAQHSGSSRIIEDEHNNEHFQVENESGKKRARKKSKKQTDGEENPARKRKKANDKTEKATKEKPKRFSHSTRQKRRTVDKVLLETPEDEIDFQRVPIKDLILLAEHKERLAKNAAATTSQTPQVNPSVGNFSQLNDEDEAYNFHEDDDGEAFGQQGATELEDTTLYFNYQTYMEKTPRVRWSKEDTELFYEAIQQFGSDFSMIQQLFPGRTRTQVRLKYKKEEQRHPSRIHDALTTRAKDHSHFEEVIKRLKQIAAQENQNGEDIDASFDLTGEEEGQKEEPELENIEENEVQDTEQDATQVQAHMDEVVEEEEEEEEEEEDIWSQYKSEV